jgi:hypothetical protein
VENTHDSSQHKSEEYDWKPVRDAGRKLEELVAVYVDNQRYQNRLLFMDCPTSDIRTLTGEQVTFETSSQANNSFPRSLVFVEVKPDAAIIPTMCEFSGGGFAPLYDTLISRLWPAVEGRPQYPHSSATVKASAEKRAYWKTIGDRYDSHVAVEVLESAMAKDSKLDWVDFRLQLNPDGETLHLHACPRGLDRLIRRRNSYGSVSNRLQRRYGAEVDFVEVGGILDRFRHTIRPRRLGQLPLGRL